MPRRRNRYKRPFGYLVGAAAVVGVLGIALKSSVQPAQKSVVQDTPLVVPPGTPTHTGPGTGPAAIVTHSPTTKPAERVVFFDAPSTRPSGVAFNPKPTPTTPVNAAELFKSVDAKLSADDLLGARDELVAALDTKKFTTTEQDQAFDRLQKINDVVVFSDRKFAKDMHQTAYTVAAGDNMQKIANKFDVTVGFLQRLNNISDPRRLRLGASLKVVKGPFHSIVNKTTYTIDLYQGRPEQIGSVFVRRLRVGLGENDSTPVGLWKIGDKLVIPVYYNSRDVGPRVINADDPTNPLGERYLALIGVQGPSVGKEGYAIHGTIDPASIGKKMSLGCVRLLNEDVNLVYDMLVKEKSTVTVVE